MDLESKRPLTQSVRQLYLCQGRQQLQEAAYHVHCALNSALVVLLLDPVGHVSTLEVKLLLKRLDGEY